jgi:TatD DNase family protein
MLRLFDAHCHLQDPSLMARLPDVLAKARSAGVRAMLCCGVNERDWAAVRQLAGAHPDIIPSFGVHPWYLEGRSDDWLAVLEQFLMSMPSGVGEIGLDHALAERRDVEQDEVFLAQLRLARQFRCPVSVHCRKAWGRLVELVQAEGGLVAGGIIHSYSGPPDLVGALESMGFYLSFSGVITRSGNRRGHKSVSVVSAERLLIETDSPDLVPVGAESDINEPANLVRVAEAVARLRQVSLVALAEQTFINACRLFNFKATL